MKKFTGEEEVLRKLVLKGTIDVEKDGKLEQLKDQTVSSVANQLQADFFGAAITLPTSLKDPIYMQTLLETLQGLGLDLSKPVDDKVCDVATAADNCTGSFIRMMADYGVDVTVIDDKKKDGIPNYTYLMILPPFLAQHWDLYNSADYISQETIRQLYISNTSIDAHTFLSNVDKFLDSRFDTAKGEINKMKTGAVFANKIAKQNSGYVVAVLRTDGDKASIEKALIENTVLYITGSIIEAMSEPGAPRLAQKKAVKTIKERNATKFNDLKQSWLEPLRCILVEPIPSGNIPFRLNPALKQVVPPLKSAKPIPKGVLAAQTCVSGKCDTKKSVAMGFLDDEMMTLEEGKVVLNCNTYNPTRIRALAEQIGVTTGGQSNTQICEKVKKALQSKTVITGSAQ